MLVAHRCSAGRDGTVDAHYGELGIEHAVTLEDGDIFFAEVGCEHAPSVRWSARLEVERGVLFEMEPTRAGLKATLQL